MRLTLSLNIGFPSAIAHKVVVVDDSEIEDMDQKEREAYFDEIAEDWKNEKADVYWEIEE